MPRLRNLFAFLFISLSVLSCGDNSYNNEVNEIQIDVSRVDSLFNGSSLFKVDGTHKLIALETNPNCVIGEVNNIFCRGERIYIVDNLTKSVFLYDLNGKFIDKIYAFGRAGNEYLDLTDVYVAEDQGIYILDNVKNKIFVYSKECLYEKSIDISDIWGHNVFVVDDNIYIVNKWSNTSCGRYRLFVLDMDGNIISKQLSFAKRDLSRRYNSKSPYAISGKGTYISFPSQNIVYASNQSGLYEPWLELDFLEQSLPEEYELMDNPDILRQGLNDKYIWGIERLSASERYLFITYLYKSKSYNTIYDFNQDKAYNIKALYTKDYFGLPLNKFFVTQDYYISYVDSNIFKFTYDYVLSENLDMIDIYDRRVAKIASQMDEGDNGVLVIHQLKGINDK